MQAQHRVIDNTERSRFELHSGEELVGFAEYHIQGDTIDFVHTEVAPQHKGRGMGTELVHAALDAARQREAAVVPHCWFVRDWIAAHSEYRGLVPEHRRTEFGL